MPSRSLVSDGTYFTPMLTKRKAENRSPCHCCQRGITNTCSFTHLVLITRFMQAVFSNSIKDVEKMNATVETHDLKMSTSQTLNLHLERQIRRFARLILFTFHIKNFCGMQQSHLFLESIIRDY